MSQYRYGQGREMGGARGKRRVWVGYILIGLFIVLGSWGWGQDSGQSSVPDPTDLLQKTPLRMEAGTDGMGLRLQDFSPRFDRIEAGRAVTHFEGGIKAVYTIDPRLQETMEQFFKKNEVPYGVFVAIHPPTGRVLAMVEYSAQEPEARHLALRATYPAASIFKLVTTAAALEGRFANPDTMIAYHGSPYQMGPSSWTDHPRRDRTKTSFAEALADSNNVVFAKVALRWLNASRLMTYGERFQFNQTIPFELPLQVSPMAVEAGRAGLAEAAAGFGDIGLSPLHAALIAAALSHDGVMMTPCLVDTVQTEVETLYTCAPRPHATIVSPETARTIREMMALTITSGTSRKAFRNGKIAPGLRGIRIGGKTGSLTGRHPPGKNSWFVGMAPLSSPEIAVAALVVNHPAHWKIKASTVAREGFSAYFTGKS
jgi:cell division protein FtsI/penicillin-binding protein 2